MSPLTTLSNITLEITENVVSQEKEVICKQIGRKERKPCLFIDGTIIYIENPKESAKTLLEPISTLARLQDIRLIYLKLIAYLYTITPQYLLGLVPVPLEDTTILSAQVPYIKWHNICICILSCTCAELSECVCVVLGIETRVSPTL